MLKLFYSALFALLFLGCSRGQLSYYEQGNLHTRNFLKHVSDRDKLQDDYYEVRRNDKGQITSARHLSSKRQLEEKSSYTYSRKGQLSRHHMVTYFEKGPPRISKEWSYTNGRVVKREEQWFTRSHNLEKKMSIYYDPNQQVFLEETWGLAKNIESSTEYYYDYEHRLDKSRRNFYLPDGSLRDYWLTIYNDEVQIINEDHYLPDNSLIAFYRYSYHPVKEFRQHEEILDESRAIFISRSFDEYGLILVEEESDRNLELLKRAVYEYTENHKPKFVHYYGPDRKLLSTAKYTQPRYLEAFRTPGL
ncbi:MAG: hypothetical protein HQ507_11505 [Candidatus Marinimicrobia bacterium]|nr:hypothetical protein [Candidatus Neomarinimicrobiota bacterium]